MGKFSEKDIEKFVTSLMVGIVITRLIQGQIPIPSTIKKRIKEIRIDYLALKHTGDLSDVGLLWIDTLVGKERLHFYRKRDSVGVGLVITKQVSPTKKDHLEVDNKKFFNEFGKGLADILKKAEKITTNESYLQGREAIIYDPNLELIYGGGKKLTMKLHRNKEEIIFEDLDTSKDKLGILKDQNGELECFIVNKGKQVYKFNFERVEELGKELLSIINEKQYENS